MTTLKVPAVSHQSTSHGLDNTTRRWLWNVGEDATALLVHVRPASRSRRPTWSATVTVWPPEALEPSFEAFGPEVSTRERALEWLEATLRERGLR